MRDSGSMTAILDFNGDLSPPVEVPASAQELLIELPAGNSFLPKFYNTERKTKNGEIIFKFRHFVSADDDGKLIPTYLVNLG